MRYGQQQTFQVVGQQPSSFSSDPASYRGNGSGAVGSNRQDKQIRRPLPNGNSSTNGFPYGVTSPSPTPTSSSSPPSSPPPPLSRSPIPPTPSSSSPPALSTSIVIHINDDPRGINRDFTCDRATLLKHMKYFETYLDPEGGKQPAGADVDISVHCDGEKERRRRRRRRRRKQGTRGECASVLWFVVVDWLRERKRGLQLLLG